jgi:hypothetical protein
LQQKKLTADRERIMPQELGPQKLELLHELVPTTTTIGLLVNPANPNNEIRPNDMLAAARTLGVEVDVLHASIEGALYRARLMLALNCSFHRRNSSTRASRTLSADVAMFGERALRSGIAEGGRGVSSSSTWPSRTLSADVGTFIGRALR